MEAKSYMSKSKEFILSRVKANILDGFSEENCNDADEVSALEIMNYFGMNNEFKVYADKNIEIDLTIKYDPDADFDYCTINYQMNDSTMLFQIDAFKTILNRILNIGTVYQPKIPNMRLEDNIHYEITYTVGDFVFIGYYDPDSAPNDKPWMTWHQKTVLPIKFDIVEH